jgi:aspartate/glutamate racemase
LANQVPNTTRLRLAGTRYTINSYVYTTRLDKQVIHDCDTKIIE